MQFNPMTHPRFFRGLAILLAVGLAFVAVGYATGWPPALFDHPPAISVQLQKAGYQKTGEVQHFSGNAGRTVTDQRWEREQEPQTIILSDDTSAGPGRFVFNAIKFVGIDGLGNLTCQPKPGVNAWLKALVADSARVREGVHDGTLQPDGRPGDFPYHGKLVGCLP